MTTKWKRFDPLMSGRERPDVSTLLTAPSTQGEERVAIISSRHVQTSVVIVFALVGGYLSQVGKVDRCNNIHLKKVCCLGVTVLTIGSRTTVARLRAKPNHLLRAVRGCHPVVLAAYCFSYWQDVTKQRNLSKHNLIVSPFLNVTS